MSGRTSDPKPVLLVAYVYPPENIVGALRPYRFAKYLPCFGYSPYVVTASRQLSNGGGANVRYAPQEPGGLKNLIGRIAYDDQIFWVSPAVRASEALLSELAVKAIFSTSPPLSAHLAALELKQRHGIRWIADFRDPLCGNFGRRSLRTMVSDPALEWYLFRHADILIANTDAAAEFWRRRYPQHAQKVRIIYNGFDPDNQQLRAAPIPPRGYRVLTHAGSIYRSNYPGAILNCLNSLIGQGLLGQGAIRIRLMGDIEDEPRLRRLPSFRELAAAGVLDCTSTHLPVEQARRVMGESDYFLLLDRHCPEGILQLPAKVFEYIQIGRPILAFTKRCSPVESVLSTSGIPHVCLYMDDSEQQLGDKLLAFLQLPPQPSLASESYRRDFNAYRQTEQLSALLDG